MIYTDRKYLSVLTLPEERDYVTYDELIRVLEERPSDSVYIERDGILRGLIVSGRIERQCDEITRRVPFNKKFTFVHPGEYLRVRQIFRDKANINALPVVSEDGRLLGDYVRWSESGAGYAGLLCNDPYILQCLKENSQHTVFVKPVAPGKNELFSWLRQRLENEGIRLQMIHHWEIKDRVDAAKYLLFANEDEKRGIGVLCRCLYRQKVPKGYTIIDYLYRMRQLASARMNESVLKDLRDQGVSVLLFDFRENGDQFLAALNETIRKRNEAYGVHGDMIHEALREPFFGELYRGEYKTQHFPLSMSFRMQSGIPYLNDAETDLLHIRDGERFTVNQPARYDRCIYLYGPCIVLGVYVSDQYTIPSLLQDEINRAGISCKVVNRGFPGGSYFSVERLQSDTFRQGDIVVLDQNMSLVENFPILNLTDTLKEHNAPADWFVDSPWHCNHKANKLFAHEIFKALLPVLRQPPEKRIPIEQGNDYVNRFYLSHFFSDFDHTGRGTVGSIVMNCNPFTFGHRFLIEEALKTVDFLIIFVVEEDESLFPFQERFAMVCEGTRDLECVMVVPSGPYILSKRTFPEYFQKIDDEDLRKNTEDDITLFAEKIAPELGITYRFVGEEREDRVTNEYNEAMKKILPRYGIQLVEIPRKANHRSVISASRVRHCLSLNQMEELDELIPPSTKRVLFHESK